MHQKIIIFPWITYLKYYNCFYIMKFVLVALLVGACLSGVSWPNPSGTKVIGAPITVKAGQTFDGFKQNGGKWIRYERGRNGLGDWEVKLMLFSF